MKNCSASFNALGLAATKLLRILNGQYSVAVPVHDFSLTGVLEILILYGCDPLLCIFEVFKMKRIFLLFSPICTLLDSIM